MRAAWDGKQYGTLSNDGIEWLDQANNRFGSPRTEQLYAIWCSSERRKDEWRALLGEAQPQRQVDFSTYLVTPGKKPIRKN